MPIHGVVKESSTTTKLRAVFDASAKTSNGISFNDTLLAGPNLYPLLTSVLTRFRLHIIAITADVGKMFREISLDPDERNYHRFLMRNEDGVITDYRMRRLTFGVKSSPFIATSVLLQLARIYRESHPRAAAAIERNFYVDDCLTGADNIEDAESLRRELCDLLAKAQMVLRKWRSNSQELLASVPVKLREEASLQIKEPSRSSKTLGIHWHAESDQFYVAVPDIPSTSVTMRVVASPAAKLFDVLGLFSPVTVIPKLLLQRLWKSEVGWDDPVPDDIKAEWTRWVEAIHLISTHPVSRRLITLDCSVLYRQIHGFADTSSKAFGAVLYLRTVYTNAEVSVSIIVAKARVAPVRTQTIPKLELEAAHLLVKLIQTVMEDLDMSAEHVYAWTDSSTVLWWLLKSPSDLKVFEANRVSNIQEVLPSPHWRHVRSADNPADLASRGAQPSELVGSELWWEGPTWLKLPPSEWPSLQLQSPPETLPGLKAKVCILAVTTPPKNKEPWELLSQFSSFSHLSRVLAWILRFVSNVRGDRDNRELTSHLIAKECAQSQLFLLRLAQEETFTQVLDRVRKKKSLPITHHLHRYQLTIGEDGLLRASGRVRDPQCPTRARSVIVLDLSSDLVQLFVKTQHVKEDHSGTDTLMAIIGEQYHIKGLRRFLKHLSRTCSKCQKLKAQPAKQQMGLLPMDRTTQAAVFSRVGVDFAGPFLVHRGNPMKPTRVKIYAVVFVCLVTKAVHLDLCCDLSAEAFTAALIRFCSKRGTPLTFYSDNGTNFVGTRRELKEVQQMINHPHTNQKLSHLATDRGIEWKFSPPRAPHFGGLWEAAVKAMKVTLRKIISPKPLSEDELLIVLAEAEAMLNSRPILPMPSTDPDGDLVLTAGHFAAGRALKSPPPVHVDILTNIDRLLHWNLVRRLTHDLWKIWKGKYLQSLSTRTKWHQQSRNFKPGDVVLIKDETLGHREWPLARVLRVFPGSDGLVRVVELRSQRSILKRSINRLVLVVPDPDEPSSPLASSSRPGRMSGTIPDNGQLS